MSKEKTKYRILRLRSGEDIIGTIKGKSKGKLIVHRPMQMKVSMLFNEKTSETQEVVFFRNWLKETVHISANIPEDHIATFLTPSAEVVKLYEEELEKEDCNPQTENSFNKNLMQLMQQQQQQQQQKKTSGLENHIEPGSIMVTLAIPPAIFLSMVANGLLGSQGEIEFEEPTDEELREIEREEDRMEKDEPKKEDNPDFGNRFDDWPDLPEDYI